MEHDITGLLTGSAMPLYCWLIERKLPSNTTPFSYLILILLTQHI